MPLIVVIVVAVAVGLVLVSRTVAALDYRRAHPTLEQRKQRLLDRYSKTDMDVDTYMTELGKLEREEEQQ